ncbi:hypothetical protein [Xanthomonas arboricola]|nr:hypothetical protein [Xanthomonas arboricola]
MAIPLADGARSSIRAGKITGKKAFAPQQEQVFHGEVPEKFEELSR